MSSTAGLLSPDESKGEPSAFKINYTESEVAAVKDKTVNRARYEDDTVFDAIREFIPSEEKGKYVLMLSLFLQIGVATVAFNAHHYKAESFDCCNMWAVLVCFGFIMFQLPYLNQWFRQQGSDPLWHRGNIMAPGAVSMGVFWAWAIGNLSMIANSADVKVFDWINVSNLGVVEYGSFVITTICGCNAMLFLFVVDYAHRNNLGNHYYYNEEIPDSLVLKCDDPVPNKGSFNFEFMKTLSVFFQVQTSALAETKLPRLIRLTSSLQVPFYVFICIAYSQGERNLGPIIIIFVGLLSWVFIWQYYFSARTKHLSKTRRWNRRYLLFPTTLAFLLNVIYFVTMSNMFFKTHDGKQVFSIIPNMDSVEKGLLSLSLIIFFPFLFVQYVLSLIHRKVWAEARDIGRSIQDPLALRAQHSVMGVSLVDPSKFTEEGQLRALEEEAERRAQLERELMEAELAKQRAKLKEKKNSYGKGRIIVERVSEDIVEQAPISRQSITSRDIENFQDKKDKDKAVLIKAQSASKTSTPVLSATPTPTAATKQPDTKESKKDAKETKQLNAAASATVPALALSPPATATPKAEALAPKPTAKPAVPPSASSKATASLSPSPAVSAKTPAVSRAQPARAPVEEDSDSDEIVVETKRK